LLAVGGVDFDGLFEEADAGAPLLIASSRSMFVECPGAIADLLPLPGTDEEIRSIELVWEETTANLEGTSLPADPVDILSGSEATEAALKMLAPGHRVLHLATHGIVLGDSCGAGAEGTRGVGGLAPVAGDAKASKPQQKKPAAPETSEAPWLSRRVYLALAGANHAADRDRDDNEGFLTAEEVSTMDLRGTEWVVLSACQSGVAAAWEREGMLGMRRAFRMAGARAVIASQWPVDDVATLEWMTALYRARATGRSTGAAIQKASRDVLAARRAQRRNTHPFYWAAFRASGA
jgi:CHAT domain-containing protein